MGYYVKGKSKAWLFLERDNGVTHLKAPFKRKKYSTRKRSIFLPFRRSYRSGRDKSIESSPSLPLPCFLLGLQGEVLKAQASTNNKWFGVGPSELLDRI